MERVWEPLGLKVEQDAGEKRLSEWKVGNGGVGRGG